MRVACHTNLDLRGEKWPDELPAVPAVGDHIQSSTKRDKGFQLELAVVRVTWKYVNDLASGKSSWVPHIEMHMTNFHRGLPSRKEGAATGSITAFYEWYAPLVGTTVGAFI